MLKQLSIIYFIAPIFRWKIYPPERCDAPVAKLLLNGDQSLNLETNIFILNATVNFILSSKRFDGQLM